ncbi:LacI family DNA-binding transcriptional regulator [Cellulomonas sp. PS-H5]|uniref:LacI family DNA-binding transcriptional regulator n=1 Tax=Cellulomonas sp. PS-H5 TaxID=2820400 RepID=UPI001C4F58B2|nr:substrate-binding domain-containing protein [Cellulomonas sp. PS-H5]MBW0254519.1 substrate-binding domain-containing protein [Cellulomonas sp. PS-H5]
MTTPTPPDRRPGSGVRVGLALLPADDDGALEPFYTDLLAGMEEELDAHGASVFVHVVPDLDAELVAYRRWARDGLVDAVVISDLVADDPREQVCRDLGLPSVLLGGEPGDGRWVVDYDNDDAMRTAVAFLADLGHRRVGWVSGPERYRHTRVRAGAFHEAAAAAGIAVVHREGDYGAASGALRTAELLALPEPPTAIVYDNDLMPLAGLREAARLGVRVPQDLSVLAWDDSANVRISHPPLSVVSRDVHELGALTAEVLLRAVAGGPPATTRTPGVRVVARGSTAPPPSGVPVPPGG